MPLNGNVQPDDAGNYGIDNGFDPTTERLVWLQTGTAVYDVKSRRWYAPLQVQGTITSSEPTSATSTPTSVNASTSSVQLLAANASAKSRSITNNGAANLYLGFGATPTTSAFKYKLVPNAVYESGSVVYTGVVNGIWDSVSGTAQVSEEV